MSRAFVYYVEPEEVKKYLTDLGYQTENLHNRSQGQIGGFAVIGTTVQVGYDLIVAGRFAAERRIAVLTDPLHTGNDLEKLERSLKLYQKLYNRFRKRRKKTTMEKKAPEVEGST